VFKAYWVGYNHVQETMQIRIERLFLFMVAICFILAMSIPFCKGNDPFAVGSIDHQWISAPGWLRKLSSLTSMQVDENMIQQMLFGLSEEQLQAGHAQIAIGILKEALAIFPQDAMILYRLGVVTIAVDPHLAPQYLILAGTLDHAYSTACSELQTAIERAGEFTTQNWLDLGRALELVGAQDVAVLVYQRALRIDPSNPDTLALLGAVLDKEGKEGLPYLMRAEQIAADSVVVRIELAVYWQNHGQTDKAVSYLRSLAEDQPANALWQEDLAIAYSLSGDLVEAYDHFVTAVNLEPTEYELWMGLAQFCIQYDIYMEEVGLPSARKAVALAPGDPSTWTVMGQALIHTGDADNATKFLSKAHVLVPNDPAVTFFLADALFKAGQTGEAFEYYIETISLAKEGEYGLTARQRLEQYYNTPGSSQ
jgi:tetratricopeptide (TPR) repeat protein